MATGDQKASNMLSIAGGSDRYVDDRRDALKIRASSSLVNLLRDAAPGQLRLGG